MEEEKRCKDCENYVRYYVKQATRYMPRGGHCALNKKKSAHPMDDGCEAWRLNEDKRTEQRQSLKEVLSEMSERLMQIADILQGEE